MTNQKIIAQALAHLQVGNVDSFKGILSGAIRSAMSDRSANSFRRVLGDHGYRVHPTAWDNPTANDIYPIPSAH